MIKNIIKPPVEITQPQTKGIITAEFDDYKPIISVKEARKLLSADAETISDDDLIRTISGMQQIATTLLTSDSVPRNGKVWYNG